MLYACMYRTHKSISCKCCNVSFNKENIKLYVNEGNKKASDTTSLHLMRVYTSKVIKHNTYLVSNNEQVSNNLEMDKGLENLYL